MHFKGRKIKRLVMRDGCFSNPIHPTKQNLAMTSAFNNRIHFYERDPQLVVTELHCLCSAVISVRHPSTSPHHASLSQTKSFFHFFLSRVDGISEIKKK